MSRQFEIVHSDRSGLCRSSHEYYLRFSNGAEGVLYLSEAGGDLRAALFLSRPAGAHQAGGG
jgi:hypothetical protein